MPTWNYFAVHARGSLSTFDDADGLLAPVAALNNHQEQHLSTSWAVRDAPADFVASQLEGIVGFELPIATLEGNWKLSQNRHAADRDSVRHALAQCDDDNSRAIRRADGLASRLASLHATHLRQRYPHPVRRLRLRRNDDPTIGLALHRALKRHRGAAQLHLARPLPGIAVPSGGGEHTGAAEVVGEVIDEVAGLRVVAPQFPMLQAKG